MPVILKGETHILFIHVPKTGGSSVENAFRESGYKVSYLDGKVGPGTLNYVRRCTPQHMHAELLEQNFRLNRFDLIFMLVRDPITRFRSEYLWRHRNSEVRIEPEAVESWARDTFQRYAANKYLFDNHMRPQAEFHVEGAQVYRFEDGLDRVIADISQKHGLSLTAPVGHVKAARSRTAYSSGDVPITPGLEAEIRRFYAADFTTFGYS